MNPSGLRHKICKFLSPPQDDPEVKRFALATATIGCKNRRITTKPPELQSKKQIQEKRGRRMLPKKTDAKEAKASSYKPVIVQELQQAEAKIIKILQAIQASLKKKLKPYRIYPQEHQP
ncbi:hypothetical protein OS493_025216 [Desmophyllum pertusum]|uniref:Uncharacterized protein n=1 Tax=Desmophyllum pertusum TaxID=174260 RepID=A0A9X0D268_9CNID|nr:hypothetical protein OS493_025216 [Desmophyllum pertusum]